VVVALPAHQGPVRALATADHRTFYSAGGRDGDATLVVWEPFASKSRVLLRLPGTTVSALAVPAGANFVCVGTTNGEILVVDARGAIVKRYFAHDRSVAALVVSPRLGWIVSAGDDVVRIWSARDLSLLHGLGNHSPRVTAVALDAEGSLLAVGTALGVVKTWALPSMHPNECFIDLSVSPSSFKGTSYDVVMADGRTVSYTLPCGAPTPPGAICTCNCVPGEVTIAPTTSTSNCGSPIPPGATCTCNCVSTPGMERCICVPVCTCMAV
jgi:WD40 repeat protein